MSVHAVNSPSAGLPSRVFEERKNIEPGVSSILVPGVFLPPSDRGEGSTESMTSSSASGQGGKTREISSDSGVMSRVMADIDAVGSTPAMVSVYSQPMGRSIMTDVVVHQTNSEDGTRKIGNHWQESAPSSATFHQEGIGASGLRVGAYEESRVAAREAYMMFQGMKVNQTV